MLRDDKVVGAVLYGDTADGAWYFDLLKKGEDVGAIRDTLDLWPGLSGRVPAWTLRRPLQPCRMMRKSAAATAYARARSSRRSQANGLTTLEEVRAKTKASASCGQCAGKVELLLAATLGDCYERSSRKAMCKCTDLTHEEVRGFIKAKELKSQPAVMQELGWKSPRAAALPAGRRSTIIWSAIGRANISDDYQSRYINERVHANIQKDGTFSVVPRMWGGVTTPDELRAIADVADRFKIPTVKVTGGQRIDLLGVKKQDLPAVWAQLNAAGMVSGFAYAKGLRTVKTCVGTEWCRFRHARFYRARHQAGKAVCAARGRQPK